ncbi:hypothetical protein L208DRAFT_1499515 [Tricholoma matsutake]|nr:hypothetical protein L208DRAFT_1499515 [Tricholoma matsutake 945]
MNSNVIVIHSYKCKANISTDEEHSVPLPYPPLDNVNNLFCRSFSTKNQRELEIVIELQENEEENEDVDSDNEIVAGRSTKIGVYIKMVFEAGLAVILFCPVLEGVLNGNWHWEKCDRNVFLPVPPATIFLIMGGQGGINLMGVHIPVG